MDTFGGRGRSCPAGEYGTISGGRVTPASTRKAKNPPPWAGLVWSWLGGNRRVHRSGRKGTGLDGSGWSSAVADGMIWKIWMVRIGDGLDWFCGRFWEGREVGKNKGWNSVFRNRLESVPVSFRITVPAGTPLLITLFPL